MDLIDNINDLLGDDLKQTIVPGARLSIAASCFSMYAYEALRAELEQIDELRFIFTSPTFLAVDTNNTSSKQFGDSLPKERREFHIPKSARERNLYGSEFEIALRNRLTQRAVARECAEWLRNKATFKSNRHQHTMQQFACVQAESNQTAYMPLHGFTAVDLGYQRGDAVSNLVNKMDDAPYVQKYLNLFEQIWHDGEKLEDVTSRVVEHIAAVYAENSAESLYFLMLFHIFNEFLQDMDQTALPNDRTGYQDTLIWNKLFNFQKDAATGIINKLDTYGGCILADSVGLGKTFTALAVIKYYELRNRSVLVLCPKKLADNWLNYNRNLTTNIFSRDRFGYDVLCHTDLGRTSGESFGTQLNSVNWGNYDLVVIDESHNFRNNDAFKDRETRYQKLMNQVIRAGVKTKVLMLSATPVNNRFKDLRNQLALAYEGDSETLRNKLGTSRSIEKIFLSVQNSFNNWAKLPPEERTAEAILGTLDFDFFKLLDSVTIARSRKHIRTFYDTRDVGHFPERKKPISVQCPLTRRNDVMQFHEIFTQLSQLSLALYAPMRQILPSKMKKYEMQYDTELTSGRGKLKQADREKSLQALMTVNLLKRLESSVASFRKTLQGLRNNHLVLLTKIDAFNQSGTSGADIGTGDEFAPPQDLDADEEFDLDDQQIGGKIKIHLADMNLPEWEHALRADLAVIDELLASMEKVTPDDDAKLQDLQSRLLEKIDNPINPGNKKVLIFTAFADTADYLYQHLAPALLKGRSLHCAKVTGSSNPTPTLKKAHSFQELLTLFAPRAKEKALSMPNESAEIDILIGTDCISEGQNLQDCDFLINYDIHWNPVRIIQRFGRVDRIGSPNQVIQLVNYWPDIPLDEYINLRERVEDRMMIADVSATGDDNVLSAQANDMSYRKEQLRRLKEEVIELEDVKQGVSITDLGLNDFRMDLLAYIKANGDMAGLPGGLHAVVPANPAQGLLPGVIFTLRNRNPAINAPAKTAQHNPLHPYYLVYVRRDGEVLHNHTEVKRILDLARLACKGQTEPVPQVYRQFNKETQDGRKMQPYSDLLGKAIKQMIAAKEEKDIDSLFSPGKTTALVHNVAGLDDFELMAFLVIQG